MRVSWCPQSTDMGINPYWRMLRASLERLDVEFDDSPSWSFGRRWLWANRGRVQVIHFHAVRRFWEYERTQARLRWVVRFARNLVFARAAGYRTVMTVHDLRSLEHSLTPDWVDFLGHWVAVHLSQAVFVHYQLGRELVAKRYGRNHGMHVLHHPTFTGVYPNTLSREEARNDLGFRDGQKVLLFFGGIRPNKGVDALITVFRRLPGNDIRLLITGEPWPPASYINQLIDQAKQDDRVRILAKAIPDDSVQTYMNAADFVVLPFRDILNSSSVLLASSFGRPVIAPALGCLPEVLTEDAGIIYNPTEPDALYRALKRASSLDPQESDALGRKAYKLASLHTWEEMAHKTLAVYEDLQ